MSFEPHSTVIPLRTDRRTSIDSPAGPASGREIERSWSPRAPAARTAPEPAAEPRTWQSTRKPTALVVDDNERQRACLGVILQSAGFHVAYAENGRDAVLQASSFTFDVIFLDVSMPLMGGREALWRIRRQEHRRHAHPSQIFIVSSHEDGDDRRASFDAGASGHLSKPIEPRLVVTAALRSLALRERAEGKRVAAGR